MKLITVVCDLCKTDVTYAEGEKQKYYTTHAKKRKLQLCSKECLRNAEKKIRKANELATIAYEKHIQSDDYTDITKVQLWELQTKYNNLKKRTDRESLEYEEEISHYCERLSEERDEHIKTEFRLKIWMILFMFQLFVLFSIVMINARLY